jgi:hypothetical protein
MQRKRTLLLQPTLALDEAAVVRDQLVRLYGGQLFCIERLRRM